MYPFDSDAMLSIAHEVQRSRIEAADHRRRVQTCRRSGMADSAAADGGRDGHRSAWLFALAFAAGLLPVDAA